MKQLNDSSHKPLYLQVSEVKVSYKNKVPVNERVQLKQSADAERILRSNWSEDMELVEEFNILLLNKSNHVKGILRLARGGISGTIADPRIIFASALKGLSTGLILSHNHPSGCLKPSSQDIDLTKKLCQIGKLHEIPVLDHLILAPHSGYYSFADEGML